MDFDVLILGSLYIDNLMIIDHYPKENTKIQVLDRITDIGGHGGNNACCIAKLDGNPLYAGVIGDDKNAEFCLKRMKEFGVSTNFIKKQPNTSTPLSFIYINLNNGNRTIFFEKSQLAPMDITGELEDIVKQARIALVSPSYAYTCQNIKRLNPECQIIFDCETWNQETAGMKELADFFIPSDDYLSDSSLSLDGDNLAQKYVSLKSHIKGELIVTAGSTGAYFSNNQHLYRITAPKVMVKDTTGAGDNFHATFAFAISKGVKLEQAIRLSNAVASISCMDYGAVRSLPDYREAQKVADRLELIEIKV
jgi:sugar/nucleoside kinase (ribokinase family)